MAVTLEREAGRLTIRLDNPPVNAVGRQVYLDLFAALEEAKNDEGIGVVVIAAAGAIFCAGADLREIERTDPAEAESFAGWRRWAIGELNRRLVQLPAPTIAAVNGAALGIGCMVAAACDLRIASSKATFGLPEIRLGLRGGADELAVAGMATGWHRYLVLTGEPIDAQTAHTAGLVQRVVGVDELESVVAQMAEQMVEPGPEIMRKTKRGLVLSAGCGEAT